MIDILASHFTQHVLGYQDKNHIQHVYTLLASYNTGYEIQLKH
ncbi:hypothetical protein VDIAB_110630 [Vibrio diabolicus]|nr:hypothetical protein VDIAB_110630 [Vibrio diabolicus]